MKTRLAFFALAAAGCVTVPPAVTPPVVTQIDHVMIVTNEAERLEALLADTLGLAVVWPSTPRPRAPGTLVGLALGDVHLELVPFRRAVRTRLGNIAMQPVDIDRAPEVLRARGLTPLEASVTRDSIGRLRWTIVGFRHGFDAATYFLIRYDAFDQSERRVRFARRFAESGGGPLGLVRVRELRIGYEESQIDAVRRAWQLLLGDPAAGPSAFYRLPAGPAIRLVSGGAEASTVVAEVRSLPHATDAARRLGLLTRVAGDTVLLDPSRFGGVRFALVAP